MHARFNTHLERTRQVESRDASRFHNSMPSDACVQEEEVFPSPSVETAPEAHEAGGVEGGVSTHHLHDERGAVRDAIRKRLAAAAAAGALPRLREQLPERLALRACRRPDTCMASSRVDRRTHWCGAEGGSTRHVSTMKSCRAQLLLRRLAAGPSCMHL